MKLNIFNRRILYKGKVYLIIKDCAEVLETKIDAFKSYCTNTINIEDIGECIDENEFNFILKKHFPNAPASIQLTNYQTLDVKVGDIIRFYPLKRMFAEDLFKRQGELYGLSVEEYLEQIDFPNEIEKEKEKLKIKYDIQDKIEQYKKELEQGIKDVNNIPFEKYGLELQHLSIIENGKIFFKSYYVGDGIFWSILPELMIDDMWEDALLYDGNLRVPSVDYSCGYMELSKEVDRDFRKYSVMDNILYCLYNIQAEDEWTDYIELRKGGINIDVSKSFLMKLINPKNCSNMYYIEGILERM